jgi:hypothetical protein
MSPSACDPAQVGSRFREEVGREFLSIGGRQVGGRGYRDADPAPLRTTHPGDIMKRSHRRSGWSRTLVVGLGIGLMASSVPLAAQAQQDPLGVAGARVVAWGGPAELQGALTPPADLDDAVAIAASSLPGTHANLAVRGDGTVVGWGQDEFGEAHPPEGLRDVVAVDIGAGFSVARRADGSVATWGSNDAGQLDVPDDLGPVTAVAAGGYAGYRGYGVPAGQCGYGLALRPDGTVVRWGQVQDGFGCEQIDTRMDPPAGLDHVVAISAGSRQALALRSDGTVVAWGAGVGFRLDGTPTEQWTDVVAVSSGYSDNLGLRADGTVLSYGTWGESGPPSMSDVAAVSASGFDVFLNRDTTLSQYHAPMSDLPKGPGYQAISAGYDYGLAIEAAEQPGPAKPPLGSAEIQPSVDSNPPGTAESFQYTAAASGSVSTFHVYLDATNAATTAVVGVYADRSGEPGALLSAGRSRTVTSGSWNAISVPAVVLEAGKRYWLSVLGPRGDGEIRFRDVPEPEGGPTRLSAAQDLSFWRGLPSTWSTSRTFANSPASLYLD